ncbi:putative glycosyl transferase [Paramagnetospirillum magnetotacticum MS-1]|uniref:Putative glycosyl transferase n=1 Tax=Paramagnetospirillum magnetotacticum MS-1 TaxID=272627 RepID=A0A0C2YDP5_PARME|nr:glycosyltransferase family 2 protein [Paramagnetospirillum magnetotacticum]KIL97829.1 putative glycosyl transferase [Paramagnetospirillum magnetotacticum MS-1]
MTGFADVSVVMPAFNNADTVGRALASIAAQTLRPMEVIVVDDGSTDETAQAVRAMAGRMNGIRLRLFRQPNQGAGAARNRAVAAAQSTWLAFLDADDEWLSPKIERSMAVLAAGDLVMCSHNLFNVGPESEVLNDSRARWLRNPADPYRSLFLRGFISSSTVVVRRDAVLAVGGFDVDLRSAQDYELWLAVLAQAGGRFETFADPLLRYTLAPEGITSRIGRKVACSLAILRRHMGILRHLPGPVLGLVVLRTIIIHYEAVMGHKARGEWSAALGQGVLLPLRLAEMLVRLPFSTGKRPDFIARLGPAAEESL